MAKEFKTNIVIGGKVAASLQKAYKTVNKDTNVLNKGFDTVKKVGVKAFKAVTASATALGAAMIATAEKTRDYRKDLAKMYNNAEMAGMSQKEAWGGLEDLYAMTGEFDSANEAMSNLIATGYKGKDLTKVIEAVNGATIKWQDTITQESLADSINETVMSGKAIGQFDEIIARSGQNVESFNDGLLNCSGLAERQQYVLSWLANSGLAEVNASYQEQNKSLVDAYKADLKYQDSMAKLGKVAEPLSALFKGKMANAISLIASKLEGVDFNSVSNAMSRVGQLGTKAFNLIWDALSKIDWEKLISAGVSILEVFANIFNFVVTNWSKIAPIVYIIVGALTAYKVVTIAINAATAIMNTLQSISAARQALATGATWAQASATGAAAVAQNGLNLAFLACPLTWIILAIVAVVAAIAILWNKCEGFRNIVKKLWNSLKESLQPALEGLKTAFNVVKASVEPVINTIKTLVTWVKKAASAIKNSKIGQAIGKVGGLISGGVATNAEGGTYSRPLLTWVSEAGDTETIVPHNNKPRSKALALEAVRGTGVSVGGNTFVFSPTINASGNSNDIRGMLEDEYNRFRAMLDEWSRDKERVSF